MSTNFPGLYKTTLFVSRDTVIYNSCIYVVPKKKKRYADQSLENRVYSRSAFFPINVSNK